MIYAEIFVVLAAIYLGLRSGGLGIGLYGGLGLAILTLGFGLPMGSIPVDVMLIIMTVVIGAAVLQAVGGMDLLVRYAEVLMRKNPKYINFIAPMITWLMTIMAGTGFIVFSTLPVIAEVAKESGIRPSRALAGSVVSSQLAIAGSPLSAAMAAMIAVMENNSVTFFQVIAVCLPVSFIASMVAAFVASKQGCELQNDVVYLERLKAGIVSPSRKLASESTYSKGAKLSIGIFLLATVLVVLLAAVPGLKPVYENGKSMSTRDIIIVMMLASSCLMMLVGKIKPDTIVASPIFRSGMTSIAVIIGIVTLGMTFVDAHLIEIKASIGNILTEYPMLLAVVLFLLVHYFIHKGQLLLLLFH